MKKILVPTDFSDTANKARDYAVQIAQLLEAEILLLNTYHIPYAGASAGTLVNVDTLALEESERQMKFQMDYCTKNFSNVKFSSHCAPGLLVETIKGMANANEMDLIVMGTTGASGVVENFLGSNTSILIGSVDTPIITVPADTHINFPSKIVVANDLTESGEDQLYSSLKELVGKTKASIDFLFITDDDQKVDKKIQRLKAAKFDEEFDANYHPFHFRESDNAEDGILEYLEGKDFDLLVVVCHQRSFWERIWERSISKSLVKHAEIPILVLTD